MRKITALSLMVSAALIASAEGYQVNSLSTKQLGMGHTGVALKLGAESQIFNPAAMSFMDRTLEVSASVTAISSSVDAWIGDKTYQSDNKVSTPMSICGAFRIYDNLYAGVSIYTPYGSSINWTKNWPGAVLTQSVDLKAFNVQPTVSWRITPKLSVGAGLMIAWGNVNLNKGLVDAASMDQLLALQGAGNKLKNILLGEQLPEQYPLFGEVSPASASLQGNTELALGFNIGAYYEINDKFSVGVDYRSKLNMHVKAGDVSVEYADQMAESILQDRLNNLNSTNFDASLPCPWILTAGVSYKPVPRLTLAFDAQFNGWGTYKALNIAFAQQSQFDQHLIKDYHNAWTWHLGAQYATTERLDLRAGLMIDTSPCNKEYYNPETPGTTRIAPSVGLSFRPVKGLSIDLAFMYVQGVKVKDARGVYDNFLAGSYNEGLATYNATLASEAVPGVTVAQYLGAQGIAMPAFAEMPRQGTMTGSYKVHAFLPSIGISYSF